MHAVVRMSGERSYPVVVSYDLHRGWVDDVEPLTSTRGTLVLCIDRELPESLRRDLISEFGAAFDQRVSTVMVDAGERRKGLDQIEKLVHSFADAGLRRDGLVIAVGGGSVGDTVGFAAAIWHRGIPWAVLPTTLLAQVDSAVGGKVGVNLDGTKNLLGVYHQPSAVICDVSWLESLPERAYRSGLGEVVKYGLGMDPYLWGIVGTRAEELLSAQPVVLLPVVRRCLAIKAQYVAFDERDAGTRRLLNLGHTFGHALEAACPMLSHGEAVALGLLAATRLAIGLKIAEASLEHRLEVLLTTLGLPTAVNGCGVENVLEAMEADKKHRQDVRTFVVPSEIGACRIVNDPPRTLVTDIITSLLK